MQWSIFFGISIFWELKKSSKINKKARIWVIFENLGKILTEHMWKEPRNLIRFNPCYLQLNHLICNVWWLIQRQDGSKHNVVRNNTRDIKKTCKGVPAKFSEKYITSSVLPTENAPYPTTNRGAEHPNTRRVFVN